ncbi:tRNA uridine-5-carboxymethylaminomethyl(34) synthesis GTPase MnmE [Gilvimarinus sp. F26214L]|uniref:tRNA uridine-5-carboxymethylaminomethyl(34) synthesis GTPase MnmE n=1 Tax=Gilvimarinus sp. DZF01 TaxID=3461371 RepID=UPI0040462668
MSTSTIAAIATAPGRGGIGIVRLSGPQAKTIGEAITGRALRPRYAHFSTFRDFSGELLDEGLAIYFASPHSFTGEDCVELQGHGGPVVLDSILQSCLQRGAHLAQPGEFSQRAFLNDKLDLSQAEAIADLIDASSQQSARNAVNSLQGVFSQRIHALVDSLTQLRIYVEAAIDFPEEEIDFLSDGNIARQLESVRSQLQLLLRESQQGIIMREGIRVAIAGRPNAGKSSLLNAIAQKNTAIVTDIEGTTRDVLREHIHLDGMPLHLIDTAGLRSNPDEVERIGIERAQAEFTQADRILLVVDLQKEPDLSLESLWPDFVGELPDKSKVTVVANKIDLRDQQPKITDNDITKVFLSAKSGAGLDLLKQHLKTVAGYSGAGEGSFTARRRHLNALERAQMYLDQAENQLRAGAGELVAEDLRCSQQALGEITGQVTADDLLGKIFSSFCIGK